MTVAVQNDRGRQHATLEGREAMLKSIGFAAAAVLAVVSFVQPPTASAQDRYSNRWNSSNYTSTQNRGDYDNHGTALDRGNHAGNGYSSDQNRSGYGGYNNGYSAPRDFGNSGSYGYGRQNVPNDYQSRQPASQVQYGRTANNWSTNERRSQSFRNVHDWDDHR
jgi:hypothetical protein